MHKQRTLVVFKPDVLQRQIVGEIISRFERKGYKIVGLKMVQPDRELAGKHYIDDEEYLTSVGESSKKFAKELGEPIPEGTPLEIGQSVRQRNIEYLITGPVVAMVLQGVHVIRSVRKFVGSGNPQNADVGTIRADYTPDSYKFADTQDRAARNIIHASDAEDTAKREIDLWFDESEIFQYDTAVEKILYDENWSGSS